MTWTSPLYGDVTIEVADNTAGTPSWVNVSADLLNLTASRGGDVAAVGSSETQAGMMTAFFNGLATAVNVAWWVRVRVSGSNIWAGYVSDVDRNIQFDENEPGLSYEVTTLICSDWVAIAGNVTVDGSVVYPMTSKYGINMTVSQAVAKFNDAISASYDLISVPDAAVGAVEIGQTDLSTTVAGHLDVIRNTVRPFWRSSKLSPTTNKPPAGGIVVDAITGSTVASFTDATTGLHYVDYVASASSSNVTNIVTVENRSMVQNSNNPKLRLFADETVTTSDPTSVAEFGERLSTVETRSALDFNLHNLKRDINLCWNPNFEYGTDGYLMDSSATQDIRRFKTAAEATPFDAYDGEYGMRRTFLVAGATANIMYQGDNANGIPVSPSIKYKFLVRGARYTTATDSQIRADIIWYDDNGAVISTITGTPVTMTNIRQWYAASHSGTAPAAAVSAKVRATFLRSGGTNFAIGAKLYADAFTFQEVTDLADTITYFSGDTEDTTGFLYSWFGMPGWSESARFTNNLVTIADTWWTINNDASLLPSQIRWNASEDYTTAAALDVLSKVSIRNANVNGGTAVNCVVVGIQWEITPELIMCNLIVKEQRE